MVGENLASHFLLVEESPLHIGSYSLQVRCSACWCALEIIGSLMATRCICDETLVCVEELLLSSGIQSLLGIRANLRALSQRDLHRTVLDLDVAFDHHVVERIVPEVMLVLRPIIFNIDAAFVQRGVHDDRVLHAQPVHMSQLGISTA